MEYGRQAAQINVSANAAAAASGGNGKAPTVFEAMVMADLDFVKLTAHPEYTQKEPVLDGVPVELSGPLQKDGESSGYVISESLAAIDRRALEAAGRAPGEMGNVVCVKVSDQEYQALSKHPAYDYQPDGDRADRDAQSLAPHLRGRLERRGQNIVLLPASLTAIYDRRIAQSRARLNARRADAGNGQTGAASPPAAGEQSQPAAESLPSQVPSTAVDSNPTSSAKPAKWWARFIFPGTLIPKADAILALRLLLAELGLTVDEHSLDFESDYVHHTGFYEVLEELSKSDLGWRTMVQIYERELQRERITH
jgi:hypothetical protein